jgi:hypothetical protein
MTCASVRVLVTGRSLGLGERMRLLHTFDQMGVIGPTSRLAQLHGEPARR